MSETQDSFLSAAQILSDEIRGVVLSFPEGRRSMIQEIRLRSDKPLTLTDGSTSVFLDKTGRPLYSLSERAFVVSRRQLQETFRRLCSYSVYSCQDEIKNGFITFRGGHRAGICGSAAVSDGRITAISNISSLNIRIARQIFGAAEALIEAVCPLKGGVLIVGPPSSGKTTLLRDIAYRLSMGKGCRMMRTVVIDERGELAGTCSGSAANDLGLCDVLDGYPKAEGIIHAVRSLSPQVILCDELGTREDCIGVSQGFHCGAFIIATVHAPDLDELKKRAQGNELLKTGAFGKAVILDSCEKPCRIREVVELGQ